MLISPFVAFVLFHGARMDFLTTFQIFTYLGVILIFLFANANNPIKFPKYLWFYLLFILYVFYSTFYILDREFKFKYLISNRLIGAFNLMLIIENVSISKKYFNLIIKLSSRILIIAIVVIIVQEVYNRNFFLRPDMVNEFVTESDSEDRLQSIYSWLSTLSNGFGFIPVFIIIVERMERKKKKILLWILFGLVYAMLTKGRWMMINALLVLVLLFVNKKDKLKQIYKYAVIIPVIALSSYITLNTIGIDAKGIVVDRILEKNDSASNTSATTRLLAITVFQKFYWKNAVFGVGDKKFGMGSDKNSNHNYELRKALGGRSSQIHVGYLSLFYTYGAVGGLLFLSFLFLIMKKFLKNARKTTFWGPFLGMLGLVLANFTLVFYSVYEVGLILALIANKYYVNEHTFMINQLNSKSTND